MNLMADKLHLSWFLYSFSVLPDLTLTTDTVPSLLELATWSSNTLMPVQDEEKLDKDGIFELEYSFMRITGMHAY